MNTLAKLASAAGLHLSEAAKVSKGGLTPEVGLLVAELKKIPGARVSVSKKTVTLVPGRFNPLVKKVEFVGIDQPKIPFMITTVDGMKGWGWDAFRKPSPVFAVPHNTLNLGALMTYQDPQGRLRDFVEDDFLPGIARVGKVWDGQELVPMPMTKTSRPAPAAAAAAAAAPAPPPKLPTLPDAPSFWPTYLEKKYKELVAHLTTRKDREGLDLLDALMDVAIYKDKYGGAKLVVRMRTLTDHYEESKDTVAHLLVEALVEGIDAVIGDIIGDNDDDDSNDNDGDEDWGSEDD